MSGMAYKVLEQGPGYTIAIDDEAHSSVPYSPADRDDGNRNHGFIDLADRPELAADIPEAQRSPNMVRALEVINAVGSRFRTIGCECGMFSHEQPVQGFDRYIGSYIAVTFRDVAANTAERIERLAKAMVARISFENAEHMVGYEITVTPLRHLFGQADRFELHVNAIGHGASDEEAWAAFGTACIGIANAFEALNELPVDDPLFAA
jgi:hypothetical protein